MWDDFEFTTQQRIGFILETETAVMLVEEGLIALAREIGQPHRLNPPFLLLAQGIERLLKLVILAGHAQVGCELLDSKAMRNSYSHRLRKLAGAVEELMRSSGYPDKSSALGCDFKFLRSSQDLRVLLEVLEAFALQGRYHDLEIAAGGKSQADLHGWQKQQAPEDRRPDRQGRGNPDTLRERFHGPQWVSLSAYRNYVHCGKRVGRLVLRLSTAGDCNTNPVRPPISPLSASGDLLPLSEQVRM